MNVRSMYLLAAPALAISLRAAATTGGAPLPDPAQESAVPDPAQAPQFDIVRFDVRGNTLLPPAEIATLLQPFTGAGRDFGTIQHAL